MNEEKTMEHYFYDKLFCDTCGHRCESSEWKTFEGRDTLDGAACGRPWCTGHYRFLSLKPYDPDSKGLDVAIREAIRAELFPLPTFDREAYKEECLLAQREEAEREAHPTYRCPRCGSSSFHKKRRGFKVGRALMGGFLAGSIGADDLVCKCNKCGCEWK